MLELRIAKTTRTRVNNLPPSFPVPVAGPARTSKRCGLAVVYPKTKTAERINMRIIALFTIGTMLLAVSALSVERPSHSKPLSARRIDPEDNVLLHLIQMQEEVYEVAAHVSCQPIESTQACIENRAIYQRWLVTHSQLNQYLKNKYGTMYFSYDENTGIASPYFGPLTAPPR